MLHILGGIALMAVGALVTVKSEWFYVNFGPIAFFERHLGAEGGSRLGYKLVGILIFFIGLLVMTDMFGGFMNWLLGPLLKHTQAL